MRLINPRTIAAAAAIGICCLATQARAVTFTIDSGQSFVSADQLNVPGGPIDISSGTQTAALSGTLDVDFTAGTIILNSGVASATAALNYSYFLPDSNFLTVFLNNLSFSPTSSTLTLTGGAFDASAVDTGPAYDTSGLLTPAYTFTANPNAGTNSDTSGTLGLVAGVQTLDIKFDNTLFNFDGSADGLPANTPISLNGEIIATFSPAPEPATAALGALGLLALAMGRRRR